MYLAQSQIMEIDKRNKKIVFIQGYSLIGVFSISTGGGDYELVPIK